MCGIPIWSYPTFGARITPHRWSRPSRWPRGRTMGPAAPLHGAGGIPPGAGCAPSGGWAMGPTAPLLAVATWGWCGRSAHPFCTPLLTSPRCVAPPSVVPWTEPFHSGSALHIHYRWVRPQSLKEWRKKRDGGGSGVDGARHDDGVVAVTYPATTFVLTLSRCRCLHP
jgi:hypothetical protein